MRQGALVAAATVLGAVVISASPGSINWSATEGLTLSRGKAQAAVGHPLSAGSVAGVHRRQERRQQRNTTPSGK
jgi:hypothetical protein